MAFSVVVKRDAPDGEAPTDAQDLEATTVDITHDIVNEAVQDAVQDVSSTLGALTQLGLQ